MDSIDIPKPVGIAIAAVVALLLGVWLWTTLSHQGTSKVSAQADAQRNQEEALVTQQLRNGKPEEPRDRIGNDKAYQPESGAR